MDVTSPISSLEELDEETRALALRFLEACQKEGLQVRITETYRPQERQNYLYALGRTRKGRKVTWTLKSRHTSRRAFDICQNIKGKEYDMAFLKRCAYIGRSLGLEAGYFWETQDAPHFERKK